MAGIITANEPLPENQELRAAGIANYQVSPWDISEPFSLARQFGRWTDRQMEWMREGAQGAPGQIPEVITGKPSPMLTPDEADQKYSIPGELYFHSYKDGVPEAVAKNLYEAKHAEIEQRTLEQLAPGGFWNRAKQFGASILANAFDPLNVAAGFVPVVGESRYADMLAEAGSTLGRALVRARVGGIAGAAGQLPLEVMRYGMSRSEQADYDSNQFLTNLAIGAAGGMILHPIFGALTDPLSARFHASREGQIAATDNEARNAVFSAAVANVAQGKTFDPSPFFEATEARQLEALPVIERERWQLMSERAQLLRMQQGLTTAESALPEGSQVAAEQLARLRQVEDQLDALKKPDARLEDHTIPVEERRAISDQRDAMIEDLTQRRATLMRDEMGAVTTAEELEAKAAPLEQRRVLAAQQNSIAQRLQEIEQRQAQLAAIPALAARELPRLGGAVYLNRDYQMPASMPSAMRESAGAPSQEHVEIDNMAKAAAKPAEGAAAEGRQQAAVPPDLATQIEAAEQRVREITASGFVPEAEHAAALAAAEDATKEAESSGSMLRAAAACLTGSA